MDEVIHAKAKILEEANANPETATEVPCAQPVPRLDEMKAPKKLNLVPGEQWCIVTG